MERPALDKGELENTSGSLDSHCHSEEAPSDPCTTPESEEMLDCRDADL